MDGIPFLNVHTMLSPDDLHQLIMEEKTRGWVRSEICRSFNCACSQVLLHIKKNLSVAGKQLIPVIDIHIKKNLSLTAKSIQQVMNPSENTLAVKDWGQYVNRTAEAPTAMSSPKGTVPSALVVKEHLPAQKAFK
jgi:hypothetical protein